MIKPIVGIVPRVDYVNTNYRLQVNYTYLEHMIPQQARAEKAMLEAQKQAYSYGYVGQFPIKELRYDNGYYMPRAIFNENWNAYWNGVVQAQNIQNQQYDLKRTLLIK